jgi:hypothetical protein
MVKLLLIIDNTYDYISLFKSIKSIKYYNDRGEEEEEALEVDQAGWEDISLSSYADTGIVASIKASKSPIHGSRQHEHRLELERLVL